MTAKIDEIPCIFPVIRENNIGDELADDYVHSQLKLLCNLSSCETPQNPDVSM
jgi:hypothetical protein